MTADIIDRLKRLDTDKLIEVVKNYQQYGYDDIMRSEAISILAERGISKEQLEQTGNFVNQAYDYELNVYHAFRRNSTIAFIAYLLILATTLLFSFLLIKSIAPGPVHPALKITAIVVYIIFLLKSFINQSQFYRAIGEDYGKTGVLVYLLLGMPLYIFMYFFFRDQMKEKLKELQ
jgi:hypothetical protein